MESSSSIFAPKEPVDISQSGKIICILSERKSRYVGSQSAKEDKMSSIATAPMDLRKIPIRELLDYCLQTNDSAGWTAFVGGVQRTITGVVAQSLRRWTRPSRELVEDRVQETYAKLFANDAAALRRFEWHDEEAIFRYLKVVSRRVVEDYRRSSLGQISIREDVLQDGVGYDIICTENPDAEIEKQQKWRQIEACLQAELSSEPDFARNRQIFLLFYRFECSARMIAELPLINLEVQTVENILLRMVRTVKSQLTQRVARGRRASE
jgi:RNA polymerase sigma factor (sigma-70 family)